MLTGWEIDVNSKGKNFKEKIEPSKPEDDKKVENQENPKEPKAKKDK